ncbi:MAG: hypothetical protein LAT67_09635 [Balneolales bacterium]|nr:hypothetical protein [Balneolales bacterium]
MNRIKLLFALLFILFSFHEALNAQQVFERRAVEVSNLGISFSNVGTIGRPNVRNQPVGLPSMQFPNGSGTEHLFEAGIWLGAQVNGQTRVSTSSVTNPSGYNESAAGFEFTNDGSLFTERSSLEDSPNFQPSAISHQDLIAEFSDRRTQRGSQPVPGHENPLFADVRMESYNWNFGFTEGITILRYDITNNSQLWSNNPNGEVWENFHFSIYSDMVVRNVNTTVETGSAFFNKGGMGWLDDQYALYVFDRGSSDSPRINTYGANVILGSEYRDVEFHPRRAEDVQAAGLPVPSVSPDFWLFGAGTGAFTRPNDDLQRFFRMENSWPEGLLQASNPQDNRTIDDFRLQLRNDGLTANGNYIQLNTIGPFPEVLPGETISVYVAFVTALMPEEFQGLLPAQVQNPDNLDNEDSRRLLLETIDWAYRLFDGQENADGTRTRFLVPEPPAVPRMRVELDAGTASIYWDDRAERSIDPVSGEEDFAGYRLYRSTLGDDIRGTISTSAQMIREWDTPDSPVGFNTGFDEIRLQEPVFFEGDDTEYVYRFDVTGMLSGWQYLFAVTAFDEGDGDSPPLETAVNANAVRVFPGTAANENFRSSDPEFKVGVYPNPYRVNAAWDGGTPFTRKLMFYNLPARAQIRVYTLAGEIVANLDHDAETYTGDTRWYSDFSSGNRIKPGGEHAWDLLTQANQNLSTGLYLYTVRDRDSGHIQRGKFAIIK